MRVGETRLRRLGQAPELRRSADAAPLGLCRQQAIGRQPYHLLARRLRGDVECSRDVGDTLRPATLDQAEQSVDGCFGGRIFQVHAWIIARRSGRGNRSAASQ